MRGQASTEFIIILSAIMVIFFIFYSLYNGQFINSRQSSERIAVMTAAVSVRNSIDYVYLAGDGTVYNTTFRIVNINVSVHDGVVWAQSDFASYYAPLLSPRINTTSIHGGEVMIRNNKGLIEIA